MKHALSVFLQKRREKAYSAYCYKVAGLAVFFSTTPFVHSFANDITKLTGVTADGLEQASWPWYKFLYSLTQQLSGPVPMLLGVIGIVGAAVALFAGHGGAGTQKFFLLIFAISICLFAPGFMNMINTSAADGLTIVGL